jgi:hypothetical protein
MIFVNHKDPLGETLPGAIKVKIKKAAEKA